MIISATGIVIDHYGDVLMIQRDDTRTLAPPGGAAEIGELPTETVVREVREETGLIVMPVRLVGLYYLPTQPNDYLSLCFRCIMGGGKITTSDEFPRAGFFKTNPLPRPMLDIHKEQIQNSLAHQGGLPYWGTHELPTRLRLGNLLLNRVVYPWIHFRRGRRGLPPYQPPPRWKTHVSIIFQDEQGHILWTKPKDQEEWLLPGDVSMPNEPPWETAVRSVRNAPQINMQLTGLSSIYPAADSATMAFTFVAAYSSEHPVLMKESETRFFAVGHEPRSARRQHILQVENALNSDEEIHFRPMQTGSINPNN